MDVLEVYFQKLMEEVSSAREFERLRTAHGEYLDALLSETFQLTPMVRVRAMLHTGVLRAMSRLAAQLFSWIPCAQPRLCPTPQVREGLQEVLAVCRSFCSLAGRSVSAAEVVEGEIAIMNKVCVCVCVCVCVRVCVCMCV